MAPIKLNTAFLKGFMADHELEAMKPQTELAAKLLEDKTGEGNDFLGWTDLPVDYDKEEFARIKAAAKKIQSDSKALIVIGIGGSYLGARAAIEFMRSSLYNDVCTTPKIYYVGNSISPAYLNNIISIAKSTDFSVNVISKSGTTTEPALAFRIFKKLLEDKYGKDGAKGRIYATTDKARGTLKSLADEEGYESFVIPDDVGGRFSVLTAVGLLPMAVAGVDIDKVMEGAAKARSDFKADFANNDCYKYAAIRNILYRKGKSVEFLVSYEPSFAMTAEWYKQLFGESEGKDNRGLLPYSCIFSTDLHSMGQYIQDGTRLMFETVVDIKKPASDLFIEPDEANLDGLNFLSGQNMSIVNRKALEGTILAHTEGGVPNIVIEAEDTSEYTYGYMTFFFEKACAISGYLLGINPFNQPGVESYKKNMFALLGKPGYESEKAALEARLSN
ncbi:MAG: glucose-6-phosphate isomerase [Oscillospiraceae bacterium]|nr:glucose-6-phosphate isomerase [Oscillospiraceae bacterium]